MVVEDVEESNRFWALFKLRCPRSTPSAEDILELCRSPDAVYLPLIEEKLSLLIKTATESGKIKNSSYVCKGFVQVIQVWAYAYIPCVGEAIGHPISSHGILLLRFKGKGGKLSLNDTFNKAKVTCMCTRSLKEVHPVWEEQDEDPEIDNLLEFLRQHKSLSTITWQTLPVYPFTPVKCNKRVASQRKSKKSKKVASSEQENTVDGGEISSDIAENKDQVESDDEGREYIIQRRQTPKRLISMERSEVGTVQKLTARIEALEQNKVKLDKLLNLGSKVLSLEGNARFPNLSLEPSNKEASKEGENMVKPNIKATDVREPEIGEDCDTRKSQPVPMEEEDDRVHEFAETLALMRSKTSVVGTKDNQLKSLDDAKVEAFTGDEDEPQKASSNIIKPSKPIRRSARVAALSEKIDSNYLVVYGPVDKSKVKALNAFIREKGHGNGAKDCLKKFLKPRAWLSFCDLEVPLAMYRQRFSKNPDVFIYPRIAILDAVFPAWWTMRYKEWLRDPSKIPEGTYKYYIGDRPKNSPPGKQWGRDVDTRYSVMFVGDCHWVLMAISIPDRTIKIYDSSSNAFFKETIKEAAMPIAHMLPYVLHAFVDDEVKQIMDKSMYSIEFVTDGVPQSKPPHGDCGIYAVKFLECLVMGVAFAD
ncbi:Uncharacterized protein Rs2_47238 [Raphanus sativus]|nr:Uncharacterized protein Rs2_47238 [Raphanus sativus]